MFDSVDHNDVGVVQLGENLRFAGEAFGSEAELGDVGLPEYGNRRRTDEH